MDMWRLPFSWRFRSMRGHLLGLLQKAPLPQWGWSRLQEKEEGCPCFRLPKQHRTLGSPSHFPRCWSHQSRPQVLGLNRKLEILWPEKNVTYRRRLLERRQPASRAISLNCSTPEPRRRQKEFRCFADLMMNRASLNSLPLSWGVWGKEMSCEKGVSLSPQEAEKQEDSRCLGRQCLQADRRYSPTETKLVATILYCSPCAWTLGRAIWNLLFSILAVRWQQM